MRTSDLGALIKPLPDLGAQDFPFGPGRDGGGFLPRDWFVIPRPMRSPCERIGAAARIGSGVRGRAEPRREVTYHIQNGKGTKEEFVASDWWIVSRRCVDKSAFGSFCRFRPRGMANSSRRSFRIGAPSIQLIMPHRSGVDQKAQGSRTKDWARWCASSFAFVAGALIAGGFAYACSVSSTASPAALRSANRSASRKRDAATRAVSGHVPASGPSLKVRASKSASNSQERAETSHRPLAVR